MTALSENVVQEQRPENLSGKIRRIPQVKCQSSCIAQLFVKKVFAFLIWSFAVVPVVSVVNNTIRCPSALHKLVFPGLDI